MPSWDGHYARQLLRSWWTGETDLKPAAHEELVTPPANDARFTNPPEVPKEFKDNGPKKPTTEPGTPGSMGRGPTGGFGGGPGTRGY
jgi:hypothetical protein